MGGEIDGKFVRFFKGIPWTENFPTFCPGYPTDIDDYLPLVILNMNFKSNFCVSLAVFENKRIVKLAVRYFDQLLDTPLYLDCATISI